MIRRTWKTRRHWLGWKPDGDQSDEGNIASCELTWWADSQQLIWQTRDPEKYAQHQISFHQESISHSMKPCPWKIQVISYKQWFADRDYTQSLASWNPYVNRTLWDRSHGYRQHKSRVPNLGKQTHHKSAIFFSTIQPTILWGGGRVQLKWLVTLWLY